MSNHRQTFRRRMAVYTAAPMFWISLVFLANTAGLIVLWIDVPRVSEGYSIQPARLAGQDSPEAEASDTLLEAGAAKLGYILLVFAGLLWPIFVVEVLLYWLFPGTGRRVTRAGLLAGVCPPLRLATPNPELDGRIWLPNIHWTHPTQNVRDRLERQFGLPMIAIALMILPVLLLEFGFREQIVERRWLRIMLHLSTGTIWFAFALEFILMYSVAPKKLQYCKEHWLDLAIILLPLISFLRSLRLVRTMHIARLAKAQQLAKMGRVYRLRGLAIKGFRALLLFEVLHRFLRISPERRIRGLREKLAEKEQEVAALRRQIESLEKQVASRNADPDRQGPGKRDSSADEA